jgi:hypothetical protein
MCDRMAEVTRYGCILRDFPCYNDGELRISILSAGG